jgi:hypothetical protein
MHALLQAQSSLGSDDTVTAGVEISESGLYLIRAIHAAAPSHSVTVAAAPDRHFPPGRWVAGRGCWTRMRGAVMATRDQAARDATRDVRTAPSLLSHVYRLPLPVPWTGQAGHSTGLERLGFYGDTLAALRAGPRAALRAGPRAAIRAGLRAALRAGPRAAQLSDQPQRHRTAGPSGQWANGADTYQWTSRPRAPGARSRSHELPLLGSD